MSHGTDWLSGRDDARELSWAMDCLHDRANRTCPKCGYEGVAYWGCFGCEQIANRASIAAAEDQEDASDYERARGQASEFINEAIAGYLAKEAK